MVADADRSGVFPRSWGKRPAIWAHTTEGALQPLTNRGSCVGLPTVGAGTNIAIGRSCYPNESPRERRNRSETGADPLLRAERDVESIDVGGSASRGHND